MPESKPKSTPESKYPYSNIDEYIALQDPAVQPRLQETRALLAAAAPEASEKISWGMPTFYLHGNLIHFAAQKQHMGLHPGAECMERFGPRLRELGFATSKGTVQLPYAKPLPKDVMQEMLHFNIAQNTQAAQEKAAKKKKGKPE